MLFAICSVLLPKIFNDRLFVLLDSCFDVQGIELNLTLIYFSDSQYKKSLVAKRLINLKIFTENKEISYKVISKKNARLFRDVSVFNGEGSIEGYFIGKKVHIDFDFLEKSKKLMEDMSIKIKKETLFYLLFDAVFSYKKKSNNKKTNMDQLLCALNEENSENIFHFYSERELIETIKKALKNKAIVSMLEFLVRRKAYETYFWNSSHENEKIEIVNVIETIEIKDDDYNKKTLEPTFYDSCVSFYRNISLLRKSFRKGKCEIPSVNIKSNEKKIFFSIVSILIILVVGVSTFIMFFIVIKYLAGK